MKLREKVLAIQEHAVRHGRLWAPLPQEYPTEVVDLIVYHQLHLSMPVEPALRSFRQLKEDFVDWNEVRVSSLREVQEEIADGPQALQLAVFIKDLLDFVHRERQDVSLEFLMEQNLGEIRKYLRRVRGLDGSTVDLVLRVRKEYPVFPISPAMGAVLQRLGLRRRTETRGRMERLLHEIVEPTKALLLHYFLLNMSQRWCPPDEAYLDCPKCSMRPLCAFYSQWSLRHGKKNSPKNPRSTRSSVNSSTRRSRPTRGGRIASGKGGDDRVRSVVEDITDLR